MPDRDGIIRDETPMIEEIDQRLIDWIGNVLTEETEVTLSPPQTTGEGERVGLYLMDILPSAPVRSGRRPPLQVMLRYLVTTRSEDPKAAHRILGRLLFAAMEHTEYEVDLAPVSPEIWTAFGIVPMPAFFLRLPLRVERPDTVTPLIRSPAEVIQSPLVGMEGVVLGPGETPLAAARVELTTHNLATRTDGKGRFLFPAVPVKPPVKTFRILTRGRELVKAIDRETNGQQPLTIHFDALEA